MFPICSQYLFSNIYLKKSNKRDLRPNIKVARLAPNNANMPCEQAEKIIAGGQDGL